MTPVGEETDEFLKSGLYKNTNPPELIYRIGNYIYQHELFLSADGRYYAIIEWWVFTVLENVPESDAARPAIVFYKDGLSQRKYEVSDLLKDKSKAYYSISHVQWDFQDKRTLDTETNKLSVTARDGKVTSFDLSTGEIWEKKQISNCLSPILRGAVLLTFIMLNM